MFCYNSTNWGRVTHIYVSELIIIGSVYSLAPERRQAIIWTNVRNIIDWNLRNKLQWNLERNSYILIKMHLKTSSAKWRPFCLGLSTLCLMYFMDSLFLFMIRHLTQTRTVHLTEIPWNSIRIIGSFVLRMRWCSDSHAQWANGCLNSSPPGQNGRHFADDIFKCIFGYWFFCILIRGLFVRV